jgi:2-oxoglutarate/2-oxoacid ferredoxin oxidoreductase subunit alpha
VLAFDLAEKYRTLAIVMADGSIGQMMEPAELPPMRPIQTEKPDWAVTGSEGRDQRILSSIYIKPEEEEVANYRMLQTWNKIQHNEIRYKEYYLDDAEIVVVGYGTAGRIALSAVRSARAEGIPVGLLRPITLSPYPYAEVSELARKARAMLVVEMNSGQMLNDVRLAVAGQIPVEFYGRMGGIVPFPDEILNEIRRVAHEPLVLGADPRQGWMQRLVPGSN